jgi:tetratricopeptide (TPR) repeat protein
VPEVLWHRFSAHAVPLFDDEKYVEALPVLAEVLATDPLNVRAAWMHVQCLAALGRTAEAEREARHVPVAAAGELRDLYNAALITSQAGLDDVALRATRSALAYWPDDGDSWYLLGQLLAKQPARALPCYERAKALGVEDPDLLKAIAAASHPRR